MISVREEEETVKTEKSESVGRKESQERVVFLKVKRKLFRGGKDQLCYMLLTDLVT
jgi:hypothetical protein